MAEKTVCTRHDASSRHEITLGWLVTAACALALLPSGCTEHPRPLPEATSEARSGLLGPDETQPGTACQNSNPLPSYGCARALDGQTANYGAVLVAKPSGQSSAWVTVDLGRPQPINRLSLSGWAAGFPARYPKDFRLLASNSGAFAGEEVVLFSRVGEPAWGTETRMYRLANQTAYRHFKLDVTANQGNDYWTEITELALRFDPAGDGLFDLDEDGLAESTLGVEPCSYNHSYSCFAVRSGGSLQQIQIAAATVGKLDVGLMGKHFGGARSAAYAYGVIDKQPWLYVLDLNASSLVAWMTTPAGYEYSNTYFDLVRGPDGLRYPFLAPGARYVKVDDPGWPHLCIFDKAKIQSPDPACATGFKHYVAVFNNYTTASGYRHNGGWVDDVDKDGWGDIHLPYLQYILSVSGRTGEQLGLSHFDVAAQSEPAAPAYFHSGRLYGSFTAWNSPSSAQRRVLVSAGNAVGTFTDYYCNVSRYMAVTHWDGGFGLDWSSYLGFSKTIFLSNPWAVDHHSRWAEGVNQCAHRTSDSLFWAGNNPVVLYSRFAADAPPPTDTTDCQEEALCEQWNAYCGLPAHKDEAQCQAPNGPPRKCYFDCCAKSAWLSRRGVWTVEALDADSGGAVKTWPQAYLWGRVYRFTPDEPYALVLETFDGDGKVRFDQEGHSPAALWFTKLEDDYDWTSFGHVSGVKRPKINAAPNDGSDVPAVNDFYAAQPVAVGYSWGGRPELVTDDIDGDGLNDVQLVDGSWVGYQAGNIVHK